MPRTQDITERVLSGEGISHYTSGIYGCDRVLNFLEKLKDEIDDYHRLYQNGRCTNYEDLYYVASQIHDSISGEYDNPAVQPLIEKILPDIQPLLIYNEISERSQLSDLADETTNYIQYTVETLLSEKPCRLDYLNCIKDTCQNIEHVDIFTLNHDTVLEQLLRTNSIKFVDGFGKRENDVRYWNPDLFENSKIRLFKLHGSVDWFRHQTNDGDKYIKNPNEQMVANIQEVILLVGTFNKMLNYTRAIFTELYCQFHSSLRCTKNLIVCGYSFGDKGINTQIAEWICSSSDHKIIVIHPNPERLKSGARPAIRNKWETFEKQNKLISISKRIEEVNWKEIKELAK